MILINGNVERVATNEAQEHRLRALGFKPIAADEENTQDTVEKKEINEISVKQLRELAEEKGIKSASSLKKEELQEILKDVI